MEEKKEKSIDELITDAKAYLDVRLEYLHLKSVETGSALFSGIITNGLIIITVLFALTLGSITLALCLSNLFHSYVAGFGCVALLYLLISIILMLTKDKYTGKFLANVFIKNYFKKLKDKDDDKQGH